MELGPLAFFAGRSAVKFSETVATVMNLVRAMLEYPKPELPERDRDLPFPDGWDSGPTPPEPELRSFLGTLREEEIYKLTLLMYLGRGDFGTRDLATHFQCVRDRFHKPEYARSQMLGKAQLGKLLAAGMAKLQRSGFDIDSLTLASARSRN
jgi:Protein of unknown function (DUF3775)